MLHGGGFWAYWHPSASCSPTRLRQAQRAFCVHAQHDAHSVAPAALSLTLRLPVDLDKEPFWYKCEVCGVGKNRFKPAQEVRHGHTLSISARVPRGDSPALHFLLLPSCQAGANYSNLMAAKKAAKAAKAKAPKGQRPRDLLRERAIQMGKEKDEGKSKPKGWW